MRRYLRLVLTIFLCANLSLGNLPYAYAQASEAARGYGVASGEQSSSNDTPDGLDEQEAEIEEVTDVPDGAFTQDDANVVELGEEYPAPVTDADATSNENEREDAQALNAESVDGYLIVSLSGTDDIQVAPFTAPLTGYYSLNLSGNKDDSYVTVGFVDADSDRKIASIQMLKRNETTDPLVYLEQGHDYNVTFKGGNRQGTNAALTLTCETNDVSSLFTVQNGVLTNYTGRLATIRIPEGVKSISKEGYAALAVGTECLYVDSYSTYTCCTLDFSLTFPASMAEVSAEELNYYNMYKYCVRASNFFVAKDSANFTAEDGVLYTKDRSKLVAVPSSMQGKVTVPEGVKTIGAWAFAYGSVTEVDLPKTLVTVEESAFENSWVREVVLPDSLTTIKGRAFAYIGWSGSSSLEKVTFGKGLKTIGSFAFEKMRDTTLELPKATETVGMGAFEECPNLTSVTFQGATELERDVFWRCPKLKKLTLNDNVSFDGGFEECPMLTDFVVGKNATEYSLANGSLLHTYEGWFGKETDLELVPASSEPIDYTIPDAVESVSLGAFCNVENIKKLTIGKKCTEIQGAADYNLSSISVASGNPRYVMKSGALCARKYGYDDTYSNTEFNLVRFPMGSAKKEFKISSSMVYVYAGAFANYSKDTPRTLTKVTIPKATTLGYSGVFATSCEGNEAKLTIAGYKGSDAERYFEVNASEENLTWAGIKTSTCKVTFNPNGGTVSTKTKSVKKGAAVGALPTPTRKKSGVAYFFLGWYTKKSGGTKITTTTKITKAQTLYAHWATPNLAKATVTVKDCTWDGTAQTPTVTVKLSGVTLKKGTHYTLKYQKNKEPGKGKVTVTGKGVFKGTQKTVSFTISKAAQTITASNVTFGVSETGKKTLSVKVKEGAKITLKSSDTSVAKPAKTGCKVTLKGAGKATITIKAAETTHYKPASKKIKLVNRGKQKISIGGSLLKYNKQDKCYDLSQEVFNRSLGIKALGGAKITCRVWMSGATNQPWIESGDRLTVKGSGTFELKIWTTKTEVCPAAQKTIAVRLKGISMLSNDFRYRQLADGKLQLMEYAGVNTKVRVANGPYVLNNGMKNNAKAVSSQIPASIFAKSKNKDKIEEVVFEDGTFTQIGQSAFEGCTSLRKVRLPISLKTLGDRAFYGCTALTDVDMPDALKTLGADCFGGCKALTRFYLPGSLTTIGERAFKNCTGLRYLTVGNNLKNVGKDAFGGCSALKNVYYSAPRSLWNSIVGGFSSGNDALKVKATKYFNAAATIVYSASGITDETLYSQYPGYLSNASYEGVLNRLDYALVEANCSTPTDVVWSSALKTQMLTGDLSYTWQTWLDTALHTDPDTGEQVVDTWAEQKINKALALELVEELSGTQELVQMREEFMDRANKIMSVVGEFRSEGENLFKDNTTRWRFAQKMDGLLPGRQASEFNSMLQKVQAVWQAVDDAYKAAGLAIDAADFVATVLMLNEYYRVYIEALMPYVPTETRLYNGLSQLSQQMNEPLETFVEDLAKEKVLKEYGKLSSDALLGFASGGSTLVAGIIFKTMGALIQTPTIDAYNKAWLSVANVTVLHGMVRDKAAQIANSSASYRWSQEPTFKLICASYFVSLNKALGYVAATQDNPAYLKQLFSRYEGALTYSAYIRSCKELVAENGS